MFNKERLRVYPYGEIIQIAFGSKGERALFGAPRFCLESMVSFSSIGCLPLKSGDKKSTLRCFSQFPDMVREATK
jgi:hypothetical protein